jgi:hypothetical protein
VSGHTDDLRIDRKGCTFGTVADAQALGDLQALLSLGRRVGRIVLKADDPQLLQRALQSM